MRLIKGVDILVKGIDEIDKSYWWDWLKVLIYW